MSRTLAAAVLFLHVWLLLSVPVCARAEDESATPSASPEETPTMTPEEAAAAAIRKKHAWYQRMGGSKGLNSIVDDFISIVSEDDRISRFFVVTFSDPVRMKTFKIRLVDQICDLIHGPCHYLGKSMIDAHAGMGIKKSHFKAMIQDFKLAMQKNGISEKDQKKLLKILKPMRKDVVNAPAKPTPTMSAGGFR